MMDTPPAVFSPPSLLGMLICFALSLFFVMLASALIIGLVIGDSVFDEQGRAVLDEFGRQKFVVNEWKTWLVNWRAHICLVIASVLFLLPIVGWLRHAWRAWSSRRGSQLGAW